VRDTAVLLLGTLCLLGAGCADIEEPSGGAPAPGPGPFPAPLASSAPAPESRPVVTFVPADPPAHAETGIDLPPIPTPSGYILIGGNRPPVEGEAEADEAIFTPPPTAPEASAPEGESGGVEWMEWVEEDVFAREDAGYDHADEDGETVEVVEVEWRDPITVPCDPWAAGAPVIVVEGWVARSHGSFPAVVSTSRYDPCVYDRSGAWVATSYDPAWDPRCDPRYGSWATYHHEREERHGDVFIHNERVQVLGDGNVVTLGGGGSSTSGGTGSGTPTASGTGGSGDEPDSGDGSPGTWTRPEGMRGFARAVPTNRRPAVSPGPALPSVAEPHAASVRGGSRWSRSRSTGEAAASTEESRERPVRFDAASSRDTGPSASDDSSPTRTIARGTPRNSPRTETPGLPRREPTTSRSGPVVEEPRPRRAAPMPDRTPGRAERPERSESPRSAPPRAETPSTSARRDAVPVVRDLPRRGAEPPAPRSPDPATSPPPAARGRGASPDDEAPPPPPRRARRRE